MNNMSRPRARRDDRSRLSARGLARFAVIGRDSDRALIRSLARRLAEGGPEAARLRRSIDDRSADDAVVDDSSRENATRKGGIYAALRRSPLVGSGIEFSKTRHPGRDIDL